MSETMTALETSANRIAQLDQEMRDERERRNELVAKAEDEGNPRRAICAAARVSGKSVCVIIAEYAADHIDRVGCHLSS